MAKKELKNKMLFFLPHTAANAPEAKPEIRFPMECRLTIIPQNAYCNPRESRIKGRREPMDSASIPFMMNTP